MNSEKMEVLKVRKIRPDAKIPVRASDGAIGYDVFALVVLDRKTKEVIQDLPVEIPIGGAVLIGIGVQMAIPMGFEAQVRPRSGLASKYDIELSNSPGTIDPDFRGGIGVLLRNRGKKPFKVKKYMRVAQLIFSKVEVPALEEVSELPSTLRGPGGFGSTGLFGKGLGTDVYDADVRRLDKYYMRLAVAASDLSRCVRGVKRINGQCEQDSEGNLVGQTRKFGCVIVREDNIIAQGFNLQYPGSERCEVAGCQRDKLQIPSGTQLEKCRATHAEEWAITNAAKSGNSTGGATLYVNSEPCELCAKTIANAGITTVVLLEGTYPNNGIKILKDAEINIRYVRV